MLANLKTQEDHNSAIGRRFKTLIATAFLIQIVAQQIMLRYVNLTVLRWVMRKFKRFQGRKVGAANFLEKLVRIQPSLFEHWRIRMIGAFA